MSLRRRRKADRIKPSDFGLEELSKINKEDTVRVMDRSRERIRSVCTKKRTLL